MSSIQTRGPSGCLPSLFVYKSKVGVYFCTWDTNITLFLWASIVEWVWVVYTDAFPAHHKLCIIWSHDITPFSAPNHELPLGLCYMLYLAFLYMTWDFCCLYFSTVCTPFKYIFVCIHVFVCMHIYKTPVLSQFSQRTWIPPAPGKVSILAESVCHKC